MKVTIVANSYFVTPSITLAELELVKKYAPASLKKTDKDGNDIFTVGYKAGSTSPLTGFSATFNSVSQGTDPKVTYSGIIPDGVNAKEYVAEAIGAAVPFIEEFEKSIPQKAKELAEAKKSLVESIDVVNS